MGTTSSSPIEGSPDTIDNATPRSGVSLSDIRKLEEINPFPLDLMHNLVKKRNAKPVSPGKILSVYHSVDQNSLEDNEALAIYSVLCRVMDQSNREQAARNMNDRGYPNEALAYLGWVTPSNEVRLLVEDIQKLRLERWSRPDGEFVEYTKFWGTMNLAGPVQQCKVSLTKVFHALRVFAPDPSSALGMLDDTPCPDSRSLYWSKEGNMNIAEQEKAVTLLKTSLSTNPLPRIENIRLHPTQPSCSIFPKRLYSKIACRIPGVRFVKVETLLAAKNLDSLESLPTEAFTDTGHFAVSHGHGDKTMLERLQKVLRNVTGILPTDGVFIDMPHDEAERLASTLFVKAIYEQCHVIFIPPDNFFCQACCMMQCMSWLLSPFPNQALGDFDLGSCLILMSITNFGKPPFFLDRPQLQVFGKMAMSSTDDDPYKEFYTWMLDDNRFKSTRLRESLTKLIFKLESSITV